METRWTSWNGIKPAELKKSVVIVGGGVAGLESARVCAIRGHKVTLFEKTDRLGGNIVPGGVPDFKDDDRALAKWYTNELKDLNIEVNYNTTVTKERLKELKADEVILATGSIPRILNIDNSKKVFSAEDVLLGKEDAGKSTIIIGAGLVGCETAL